MGAEEIGHHALAQRRDLVRDVLRFEDGIPQLIDFATLVVGDVVVFQQLLADVEIVRLDLALRALDRSGNEAMLDRLALRHAQALHDRVDPFSGEDPQQRILERQVKARGARIRSEEHTSELQSLTNLVCRLLLEKKKKKNKKQTKKTNITERTP